MTKDIMTWNELGAVLIRVVHIAFIAWVVYVPFSDNLDFLLLHAVVCPFLMLHWATSSAGCALTLLEKRLRGLDHDDQSFIHKIVAPIYVIDDATLRTAVFGATIGLWVITLTKVHARFCAARGRQPPLAEKNVSPFQ